MQYFHTDQPLSGFAQDQMVYDTTTEGTESVSGLIFSVCGTEGQTAGTGAAEGQPKVGNQYLSLIDIKGQFANGFTVTNRTGDTATITSASLALHRYPLNSSSIPVNPVIEGGIAKYTGEILYHENILPITRKLDQKEEFKFVFEF